MKWIKLKDKLPEEEEAVLIYIFYFGRYQMIVGAYKLENNEEIWYDWQTDEDISTEPKYWQPLPETPK